jgi:RNA polymerase-binding transcription factor DksA
MTKNTLEESKKKLLGELSLINEEIKKNERPPEASHDVDAFDGETDETDTMSGQLAVAQDLKNRRADIELALQKIDSGAYGLCENCKKEIEAEILNIDPESRFCKNCKLNK